MAKIIVASDAESIRALADLEDRRALWKTATELDKNSMTRRMREDMERWRSDNYSHGGWADDGNYWIADYGLE